MRQAKSFLFLALIVTTCSPLWADDVPPVSDSLILVGALTESVESGSGAFFPNPALLSLNRHQSISGSYGSLYDNAFQRLSLAYALSLGDFGSLGASGRYYSAEGYDHAGVAVAYSREVVSPLYLGGSVGIRGDDFSFPQVDLSLGLLFSPLKSLYLGLNFDDLVKLGRGSIGGSLSYTLSSYSFLREVNLTGQVRATKGIDSFSKGGIELSLGNENWVFPPLGIGLPFDLVGNRVGVTVDVFGLERYSAFDAGLGLRMGELQADYNYRYSFHSRLNTHIATLSYHFRSPWEEKVEAAPSQPEPEAKQAQEEPGLTRRTIEDMSIKGEESRKETGVAKAEIKVYSGPGDYYPVVAELKVGTQLSITGSVGKWYKVVIPEGKEGWVRNEDLVKRDIIITR
jgi:hypothetical protein